MRIAMMGAGGVGAYFAVMLDGRGHEIVLIDRDEHAHALARTGVALVGLTLLVYGLIWDAE